MPMRISSCRVCGCTDINEFFDLGDQPFANGFVSQPIDELKYPLSLSWCSRCGLVQLNHTADPKVLFSHYVWVTSSSATAKDYAETFFEYVLQHVNNLNSGSTVLEIASNDGTFLKPFIRHGCRGMGVDPAENIVTKANAEGVPTLCGFFGESLAEQIVYDNGFADIVIARNVLPHVANLHDFVKGIHRCMHENSIAVIEVHYAKTILEQLHYDSIYHEHLCYFTLKSLTWLLSAYELTIYDIIKSPISGGSIVVFACRGQREKSATVDEITTQETKCGSNDWASWKHFADASARHSKALVQLLHQDIKNNNRIVGYGASARASTLLNYSGIDSRVIRMIADQNQMKHNLFTPGAHIPIATPETVLGSKPDTIVILAWNFFDEITQLLWQRFKFRKTLVLPLPAPPKRIKIEEIING